jgi:hypothetical protein
MARKKWTTEPQGNARMKDMACDIERTIAATLSDGESDLFIVGSECHLLDATRRRLGHEPTE